MANSSTLSSKTLKLVSHEKAIDDVRFDIVILQQATTLLLPGSSSTNTMIKLNITILYMQSTTATAIWTF